VLAFALSAGPALAEQPMDRLERMIEQGKGADAVDVARKWLEKNESDRRVQAVRALLDEALWLALGEEPTLDGLAAYRAEFPESSHESAARELEASMAYYAAIKDGSEDAFRAVVDAYAGTPAAADALEKAADAGYSAAELVGSSEAWSTWISRYPNSEAQPRARAQMEQVAWAEAEAENTVQAWLELRAANPNHPRAEEARERESTLAAAEAQDTRSLLEVAARYQGTPAARSSLRRAIFGSNVVAVLAGARPLVRGPDGGVVASFGAARERVSKLMQSKEPLPADTIAAWLELEAPLPRRVAPEWMRTGLEPAPVAAGWLAPTLEDGMDLGPGALRLPQTRALGMRAKGFGDMELSVLFAPGAGPAAPDVLAQAPRPAPCPDPTVEPTQGALLRRWEPCGSGLISPEIDGWWATSPEALTAAGVALGADEPVWGMGCPAPGPSLTEPGGGPAEAVSGAPSAAASSPPLGDDDDSATPPDAPPVPAWLGLGPPDHSDARDLDGDGFAEGLHILGERLVVVDGRGLTTRVFVLPAGIDGAMARVRHDGCSWTVPAQPSP
jgi:hypothetical protein